MSDQADKVSSAIPQFMVKAEEPSQELVPAPQAATPEPSSPGAAVVVKSTSRLLEMADYLSRVEKVLSDALPRFIAENPLGECVDLYVALEAQVESVETAFKAIKSQISACREVHFPARLDEEQTKTHTSTSGIRMTRTARVLASILTGKQDEAFEWLRKNELGSLIKETVNSSSLCAAAKELMQNGKELPETTFNVHLKDGVSITKPRAGK